MITDKINDSYTIHVTHDAINIYWTVVTTAFKMPRVFYCSRREYLKQCVKMMSLLCDNIKKGKETDYTRQQLSEFKRKLWNRKFVVYGLSHNDPESMADMAYGVFDLKIKTEYDHDSDVCYNISVGPLNYCSAIIDYSTFPPLRNQLENAVYCYGEECRLRFIYEYFGESTYLDFKEGMLYITHPEGFRLNDLVAYIGSCYGIIRNVYCHLLSYAVYRWRKYTSLNDRPNGEALYNQMKSVVIERYLQGIRLSDDDTSTEHAYKINHVLTMKAGNNGLTDEFGNCYVIENDTICLDRLVRRPLTIKVSDLSLWLTRYDPQNLKLLRGWWFSKGEKIMKKIKAQLPSDIDLWLAPAEGSEWPFLDFPKLYMTQHKPCYMDLKQKIMFELEGFNLLNKKEQESVQRFIGRHFHSCTKAYNDYPSFDIQRDRSTDITKITIHCKNCDSREDITDYSSWQLE
ncbi:MAG: hypothetical protein MJZ01_03570 [Bacteroidales bacterium]|nr:hypothetical protein [Bacteroidales bacterium]